MLGPACDDYTAIVQDDRRAGGYARLAFRVAPVAIAVIGASRSTGTPPCIAQSATKLGVKLLGSTTGS